MRYFENNDGSLSFVLPRMLGSRAKAVTLTSELKDMLDGKTIEVIGTDSVGATASFVDEFCTQILTYRNAEHVIFVNVPEMFKERARFYSIVRGYSHKISFTNRDE